MFSFDLLVMTKNLVCGFFDSHADHAAECIWEPAQVDSPYFPKITASCDMFPDKKHEVDG